MADTNQLNDALAANYLLVDIEIRSWSGNKTDRSVSKEVLDNKGATKDAGKFVKNLLAGAAQELDAVHCAAQACRVFLYSKTLPWSGSTDGPKRGARLLAATDSIEFLRDLNALKTTHDLAVQALASVWDVRCGEARVNLGGLADEGDYPDSTSVASLFGIRVDLKPVPSMADFSRINVPSALADALGQRHAQQAEQQLSNAMDDLKERLLKELQRIATQMGKVGAGEKTRVYETLITNLQTVVNLIRTMNVAGKPELATLADKIDAQLLAQPITAYKNSPAKAAELAQKANEIAADAAIEAIWK